MTRRLVAAVVLTAGLGLTGCPMIGQPVKPPPINSASDAWASSKIAFGTAAVAFKEAALLLCPPPEGVDPSKDTIPCPDTLTDAERVFLSEGQAAVDEFNKQIAPAGDDLISLSSGQPTEAAMLRLMTRVNQLVALLNRRIAEGT